MTKNHNLVETFPTRDILVEHRPVRDRAGQHVAGLHNIWITLNNPAELNAYTTDMIKGVILSLREASNDRAAPRDCNCLLRGRMLHRNLKHPLGISRIRTRESTGTPRPRTRACSLPQPPLGCNPEEDAVAFVSP